MHRIQHLPALPRPASVNALSTLHLDWLCLATIPLSILAVAVIYIWPNPLEFPMDDTYIHFVYARNLSEQGALFFNHPGEKGVGTSSLLWVLLLAAGNHLGLPLNGLAVLLGLVSLFAVGVGLYLLLRPYLPPLPALVFSLLVVLSGHMLWFSLSGMETTLFLALGIWSILCFREKRWGWLGVLLGLMVITRLEGVILALVIAIVDIWRQKAIRRGLLVAGAICICTSVPWVIYLWLRTGYFLPTSGVGKHFSSLASILVAASKYEILTWIGQLPAITYPLTGLAYTIEFILGGFALPAPYIVFHPGIGPSDFKLSIWAVIGIVTVIVPLLWISVRWIVRSLRSPNWESDDPRQLLVIFLVWVVFHNLSYMIYLPSIGTASRYTAINQIALWISLASAIWLVRKPVVKTWLAVGLTVIALANTLYWNKVYDSNLEHMLKVRIASANYLREQYPSVEKCAASDIGAVRYFSGRQIVDLGCLIDPSLSQRYLVGELDRYLVENGITCLVIPGRAGTTADGFFDVAKELGLSQSSLFTLQPVATFEIDRERWLLGYLPVINSQARITIYRIMYNPGISSDS